MVCGVEMDQARGDFEFAMNKCYFDANMLNRTNFNVFRALKVGWLMKRLLLLAYSLCVFPF